MACNTAKVSTIGLTARFIKVSGEIIKEMEKVNALMQEVIFMKVIGMMINIKHHNNELNVNFLMYN